MYSYSNVKTHNRASFYVRAHTYAPHVRAYTYALQRGVCYTPLHCLLLCISSQYVKDRCVGLWFVGVFVPTTHGTGVMCQPMLQRTGVANRLDRPGDNQCIHAAWYSFFGCYKKNGKPKQQSTFIQKTSRSRKEVFQPHLPVRLPCYDLAPVIRFTLGDSFYGHRLQVPLTPMA